MLSESLRLSRSCPLGIQRKGAARHSRNQRGWKIEEREWPQAFDKARLAHELRRKCCQENKILGYSTAEKQRRRAERTQHEKDLGLCSLHPTMSPRKEGRKIFQILSVFAPLRLCVKRLLHGCGLARCRPIKNGHRVEV